MVLLGDEAEAIRGQITKRLSFNCKKMVGSSSSSHQPVGLQLGAEGVPGPHARFKQSSSCLAPTWARQRKLCGSGCGQLGGIALGPGKNKRADLKRENLSNSVEAGCRR